MRSPAVLVLTALSLTPQLSCTLRKRGRKGGQVAEAKVHIPLPAPHAAAPAHQPRAAAAPHSAAPRVAAPHGPGPGPRRAAPHAVAPHVSRAPAARQPHELTSPHRMLPPSSQLQMSPLRAAGRSTPLPAGARRPVWVARPQNPTRLRRYPALLAQRNERGSTPLHLQLLREDASVAINRLKGNPLATRSLVTVLPRVQLAQSPSPLSPRIATEIEMQIAR